MDAEILMSEHYRITVYVAGMSATARRTLRNLESLQANLPEGMQMDVDVVDVLEQPEIAERERVLATPMVVKEAPEPVRRVIGDLSSREDAISGLDLAI
jgi:circadian clock protein KaiB